MGIRQVTRAPKALKLNASNLLLLVFSPHGTKLAKDNQLQMSDKCPAPPPPPPRGVWLGQLWMEAIPEGKYQEPQLS